MCHCCVWGLVGGNTKKSMPTAKNTRWHRHTARVGGPSSSIIIALVPGGNKTNNELFIHESQPLHSIFHHNLNSFYVDVLERKSSGHSIKYIIVEHHHHKIMDQQFHSSPIQTMYSTNMFTEPHYIAYPDDVDECDIAKAAATSSTRSPNTVIFAVDELSSVFRVADDHIEHDDSFLIHHQDETSMNNKNTGSTTMLRRGRYLTPSSFTTDGELSTFSEDTEEGSDESSGSDDNDEQHQHRFYPRRRSSAMSIFRASSGTKRRCEFEEDDEINILTKRSCSAPLICHANPIGSDDGCDDEEELSLSSASSYAFASPFKRICRSGNSTAADNTDTITFTSLFSESTTTLPAAAASSNIGNVKNVTLTHLHHPLSLETSPFAKLFPKNTEYQG